MKLQHFLLTALILFTGVSGVYAGKRYVGFTSAPSPNYPASGTGLKNALDDAQEGDTVFVATGLYVAGATEFTVKPNVTLIGGYAKSDANAATRRYPGQFVPFTTSDLSATTELTILDGNAHKTLPAQKHRVIKVNADGVVDGCLIRNGHIRNGNGGGVFLNGGKLYNSIVRGNVAMNHPDSAEALGGGVFIQGNGELINCLVAYNMANDGYGVAAGTGGGKMINNTITANTYSPVFAKIPGGKFQMYKGGDYPAYRLSTWPGDTIPKWPQIITLRDFYISRILTTEGQFAVFCAAIDIPIDGSYGQINVDTLKLKWADPIEESTLESRYKFGTSNVSGLRTLLQSATNEYIPGLKYDAGVWHPVVDTATVEYPMGNATWFGCLAYSVWLGGGLPTLAQWQFAARREPNGTVNDNFYSGAYGSKVAVTDDNKDTATWRILDTIAWLANSMSIDTATGKLGVSGTNRPHEVARKRPNAMGIYDMTGSMMERCADWYIDISSSPYSAGTDPINNNPASSRVLTCGYYEDSYRANFPLTIYSYNDQYTPRIVAGFRPVVVFK